MSNLLEQAINCDNGDGVASKLMTSRIVASQIFGREIGSTALA